ncbi:zinc-binding protein [Methanobrevibacter sp. 87.7]|uniref:putative zinc-binding protein n=1 Tax=Methanobrevibacter sp. 87.7 TaxID=387957 RepID=UPI000B5026CD|nr:putative zinc-binding protein [Methanobrevibacter sp. 87.7]OWT32331.1 zinc-binding protein [Methanobrevibacter sp. 87.7]
MENDRKIAIAGCSGMSPNGLVARAAVSDMAVDFDEVVSLCMGSIAADNEDFLKFLNDFDVIAINGCEGHCVNKILEDKGANVIKSIDIDDVLKDSPYRPNDVARLDEEGEKCVSLVKDAIKDSLDEFKN